MEGFALIDTGIWSIVPPLSYEGGVFLPHDWRFCWHGDLYLHH